jgi:hypothetical protein
MHHRIIGVHNRANLKAGSDMSIMKAVYIVILLFFIGACAHTGSPPEFSYYGTFCGPGEPVIAAKNPADRIAALEALPAVDDMDWACKQHDLCYARLGHSARVCDELLNYVLDHWALPSGCNSIGYDIKAYFYRLHPSRGFVANMLNPVFNLAPKLVLDHTFNLLSQPGSSPYVRQKQCFFDSGQRRSYLEAGRKFGGPFEWGRPLPRSIREAKRKKYPAARNSRYADRAAYDLGLISSVPYEKHCQGGRCRGLLAPLVSSNNLAIVSNARRKALLASSLSGTRLNS